MPAGLAPPPDLGIFKAIGMTPRQTIATVVCSVAGTGLVAGLLAVPAGMAVHRYVLPVMAHAAGTGIPASYLAVYRAWEIAVLALTGLIIAAAGGYRRQPGPPEPAPRLRCTLSKAEAATIDRRRTPT